MRMLICQLSDIHFKETVQNGIFEKIDKIISAIRSRSLNCDSCFLVFSGDISYSGKSSEYNIAFEFITKLTKQLEKPEGPFENVLCLFVPGNHDCDFGEKTNKARDIVINSIKERIEIDESILKQCILPQNNFFDLCSIYDNTFWENKLYDLKMYTINDKKLLFLLLNTSWMSQKKEIAGRLYYPEDMIPNLDISRYDAVIAVFHHPFNWFIPHNSHALKKKIENCADIIITGHEHCSEKFNVESSRATSNGYYLGGVLQEHDGDSISEFNIILIDLSIRKEHYSQFKWNGKIYEPIQTIELWNDFSRNKKIREKSFIFSDIHHKYLDDISVKLNHPYNEDINLSDIYIYPDLEIYRIHEKAERQENIVRSDNIIQFIKDQKKLLITGPDNSGKTTMGKRVSYDLLKDDIISILIDANEINTTDETQIQRTIKRVFEEQYNKEMFSTFEQYDIKKKAIIIDDFNRLTLNNEGIKQLISIIYQLFDIVLILADDFYRLQHIANKNNITEFLEMANCVILGFGYFLRDKLIKRWHIIGREYTITEEELLTKCEKVEKLIDTIIGKGLIPSYPIYILLLLNQYEVANNIDPKISSYGYLYQMLINNMLINIDRDNDNISINDSYLTELAYFIFNKKKKLLTIDDILEINDNFCTKYALRISHDKKINDFLKNQIFEKISHSYRIKFKYVYYYFVAKYLADNINLQEVKNYICELSKKIYIEEYANILLFLCHLKKEQFIIDEIMLNAMVIFDSFKSFDFENYVQFIKVMYEKVPKIFLPASDDVSKNREEQLKIQDKYSYRQLKESQEETAIVIEKDDIKEEIDDAELNEILTLNKAFKTLEILGQILKNYPGKILGDTKYDIALECHTLGMRIVEVFLELIDSNADNLINNLVDELRNRRENSQKDLENNVRRFIYFLVENITFAMIRKISDSIANDKLIETYKELLKRNDKISFKLVNLSIKFDCLNIFNSDEIISLFQELRESNNKFAESILRRMVVYYMYLHKVDYKIKQSICQELKIESRNVTILQLKGDKYKKSK